jgi:subtilase family serine protease
VAKGVFRCALVSCVLLIQVITGIVFTNGITVTGFPDSVTSDFVLAGIPYPFPVSIGDVNNDSLNDIVVGSRHAMYAYVGVYYQRANRTFDQLPDIRLNPGKASCVAVGDVNNDTLVDVVAASWIGHTVSIFYQRTNNTLNSTRDVVLPLTSGATYLAVSDLNDDGLNDIAVTQTGITIFYQKNNNTFGPGADIKLSSPGGPDFVLADDLNSDGLTDLAAANPGGKTATVYYQNPDNTMPTNPNVTLAIKSSTTIVPAPQSLASGDLNGDGLTDLAVGSINAENNAVVAFFQQENHTLPSAPNLTISFNRGSRGLAIGDLNNDGLDDLIAGNYWNHNATVYYQRCDHSIPTTADLQLLTARSPHSIAIAKLNNDSMNDIVLTNGDSNRVFIYLQEIPSSFLLPDFSVNSANMTVSPSGQVLNGTMVLVNATVSNDGECTGCDIPYAFYDGDPTSGGQLISGGVIDSLLPTENATVQTSWVATPYGTHDIYLVVDSANLTLESNETNNKAGKSVTVLKPEDLLISTSDISTDPISPIDNGTLVTLTAAVHNIGDLDASDVMIRFYDGNPGDPVGSGPGIQIGSDEVMAIISAGDSGQIELQWLATPAGSHEIHVVVDPLDSIQEFNESNNRAMVDVEVVHIGVDYIDYVPWNATSSQQDVSVGESFMVTAQVRNIGSGDASLSSSIAFYNLTTPLSPFATHLVPPLGAGEISGEYHETWTAPTTAGTYCVVIEVDYYYDMINESNESNNTWTIEFNVSDKPVTEIHIGTPNYSTDPTYVNSSTQFSFTVTDFSGTGYETYYYINNPPWKRYTLPFTILAEGSWSIHYNSTDNSGGVEETKEFQVTVDNTPPSTTVDFGNPKYVSMDIWVTSNTELSLHHVDGGVGTDRTEYRIWNGIWTGWEDYIGSFTLGPNNGRRFIEWFSVDLLGNVEHPHNCSYLVDNASPLTESAVDYEENETLVRMTLTASDAGSGLNLTRYRVDLGDWTEYSESFVISEQGWHTVYFHSVDLLGNIEEERNRTFLIEEPAARHTKTNYKPLVASIFTIILALLGFLVSYRRPLSQLGGNKLYTWLVIALPFMVAEIVTGVSSMYVGLLEIPPILGIGMVLDVSVLLLGLISFGVVFRRGQNEIWHESDESAE